MRTSALMIAAAALGGILLLPDQASAQRYIGSGWRVGGYYGGGGIVRPGAWGFGVRRVYWGGGYRLGYWGARSAARGSYYPWRRANWGVGQGAFAYGYGAALAASYYRYPYYASYYCDW
jgi:hypothetical protein